MKKVSRFSFLFSLLFARFQTDPGYRQVTAEEAGTLMAESNPVILDVRTPHEYAAGHIKGSALLPVQALFSKMEQELSGREEAPILVVCATGSRSSAASLLLTKSGFTRVYNLDFGIKDWMDRGFPVVT